MTTSDPSAPFQWLSAQNGDDRWLGEIFTVTFFRGLDPSEVVRRFSRGEDQGQESGFDELAEQASENSFKTGGGSGGGNVGVVQVGEWSVAIELIGWMATLPDVLAELSRDCEVLAITRHDYAEHSLAYAIDGTIVTGYNLTCPHLRHGSEPDRLNGFMRELGSPLDMRDDEHDCDDEYDWDESDWDTDYFAAVPRAFALAAKLTQVRFIPEILDRVMLVGPVAYR
ncbi:DUF6461 domain-containing protein [Nocardia sp. CA-107356]|uniref:DUF6461 domain-containing protein n=1 Tax=Nocardia sp. CA-107356 TaxID=3239972 RepID=UPI003D8AAB4C